jgi:hypothetical protein
MIKLIFLKIKLKSEIISEKKKHEDKCPNKTNCGTSMMYNKSIEIIDSRIQKYQDNKFLKFLSKFWWAFIIPILIGVVLFYLKLITNIYITNDNKGTTIKN